VQSTDVDESMMRRALDEARSCERWGDVPVGATIARGEEVLASAGNARERLGDPTAHAEILALRAAAATVGSWRLDGCTVYVTLEPCAMCSGGLVLARIEQLVYGAPDPKAGFVDTLGDIVRHGRLNHRVAVRSGVLADESGALLREFFRSRRDRRIEP
jgi:tRNA(adenine34) deaminase